MLRRWFAWCAVATLAILGTSVGISLGTSHTPTEAIRVPGPLVLISVPELSWTTGLQRDHPEIYTMTRHGAVGGVLVRNYRGHSCAKNGWLSVAAVARTGVGPGPDATPPGEEPDPCPPIPTPIQEGQSAFFPEFADYRRETNKANPHVDLGILGSSYDEAGACIMAAGPGAGLGAANRLGVVHRYVPRPTEVDFRACPLTLVSLESPKAPALPGLLDRIPDGATVIVAGLADGATPEHLRGAVITGPDIPHGRLTSLNTRQPGVVTTADLALLLLQPVDAQDAPTTGARLPLVLPTDDVDGPLTSVRELGTELAVEYSVTQTFFVRALTLSLLVLGLGVATVLWLRHWARAEGRELERSRMVRGLGMWIAGSISSIPAATFLIGLFPWWRASHPGVVLTAGVLGLAVTLSWIAFFGPWRRWRPGPIVVILGVTALTVAIDVVHGTRLQFTSMLGLQPVYGGRFYGVGNVGFAMMATSALVVAAILAGPSRAAGRRVLPAVTVLLVGIPIIIVDGYPEWGADGGGPAALVPAFAYLAMNAAGLKVTWQRVAVIGSSTLGLLALVGFADYLRPPEYRTHLGAFVADVIDRGQWGTLEHIIVGNWRMLTSAWYMPIGLVLLAAVILVLIAPPNRFLRPAQRIWESVPFLGHGLAAAAICWTIGFFANDSGTGIPPIGLFVLTPLIFALGIHVDAPASEESGHHTPRVTDRLR